METHGHDADLLFGRTVEMRQFRSLTIRCARLGASVNVIWRGGSLKTPVPTEEMSMY